MRLQRRRPFHRWLTVEALAHFGRFARTDAEWVIGLDPGHDSMQAAVQLAYWPTGRLHAAAIETTRHRAAATCLARLHRQNWPTTLEIATEATAAAVPAGHTMSLKAQLERKHYRVWCYRGSAKGRIDALAAALSGRDPRFRLTVEPTAAVMIDALHRYECKTNAKDALHAATRSPAHAIDALSYAVAAAMLRLDASHRARSVGPAENPS